MNETLIQRTKQRYDIIGNTEALHRAIDIALKIAPVDLSVLITGENGVGKEVFPRIIHDNSLRRQRKYFAVNCGAIPEGTIDSELFGHEKGAFTGAVEKREGYFAAASGGTLFLDEVGELPLPTQARLLRVLETGEYIPVGASEVKKTDVRIVAATNVDMESAIAEGKFREDLYYRLNAVSISVPPLRERGDDIPLLFRKFAFEMSEKYRMPAVRLTEAAKEALKAYGWPGNVRQLKNVAESMSVTAEVREITPEILSHYLPEERPRGQMVSLGKKQEEASLDQIYAMLLGLRRDVDELQRIAGVKAGHSALPKALPYMVEDLPHGATGEEAAPFAEAVEIKEDTASGLSLEEQEKELIRRVLRQTAGRRKEAAQILGISDRTLYRKIHEYGLEEKA